MSTIHGFEMIENTFEKIEWLVRIPKSPKSMPNF